MISIKFLPSEHASHMQTYLQYQRIQSTHMSTQSQHPNSQQHSGPFHWQDAVGTVNGFCLYRGESRTDIPSQ